MKKILFLMMFNLFLVFSAHAEFVRDNTKQIVTDNRTGLMWQDDAVSSTMTWAAAITYCEDKELGGYSDWRLPNQRELLSIDDRSRVSPAISPVFVNTASNFYWSSTTNVDGTDGAWFVEFNRGSTGVGNKNFGDCVRCVRGGQ